MSVFRDDSRSQLEQFSRAARQPGTGPSPYNHFLAPDPDQLLRVAVAVAFRRGRLRSVYALLRGKDMDTGEFVGQRREEQFAELQRAQEHVLDLTSWHEFLKVLVKAGYRNGGMLSSQNALLYAYALFLIGKRDFGVEPYRLRAVMARWFFMTALTSRYTTSFETRIESDLARLRPLHSAEEFVAALDHVVDDTLTADFWRITLVNDLATSASRSPSLFADHAALNLLDAKVLFSPLKVAELMDPALRPKKGALERHHLFPRAYLGRQGVTDLPEVTGSRTRSGRVARQYRHRGPGALVLLPRLRGAAERV
jgi:hypothetical protein